MPSVSFLILALASALLLVFAVLLFLSQHRLAHSVRQHALVQVPIRLDVHFELVPDAHQEQSAVTAVDRDLPDQLVEALIVQVFSLETNPRLARLSQLEQLLEVLVSKGSSPSRA